MAAAPTATPRSHRLAETADRRGRTDDLTLSNIEAQFGTDTGIGSVHGGTLPSSWVVFSCGLPSPSLVSLRAWPARRSRGRGSSPSEVALADRFTAPVDRTGAFP